MSAVPNKTEAFLTSEFEMGSGEPGSYDRPKLFLFRSGLYRFLLINVYIENN